MTQWQVVVGNVGTVYSGPNGFDARRLYGAYVGLSRASHGRASGESVTLLRDDGIVREYAAPEESDA